MEEIRTESTNRVFLRGFLLEAPEYSHENHGIQFDLLRISVQRLSGVYDHLNVIAEHLLLEQVDWSMGSMVEVEGEIRSFNNKTGLGRKLIISVYATALRCGEGQPENHVTLTGEFCREPIYRHTPLGREITDVMLAVERKYRRRDYVPCILWGSVARMAANRPKGTKLALEGRLQSRCYVKQTEKGPEERTAFEVSAIRAEVLS